MIQLHIFNANGKLTGLEDTIKNSVNGTIDKVTAVIPVDNVDLAVGYNSELIIEGYGLGGSTHSPNFVELDIDPIFPNIKEQIKKELPPTLAHELHHCMRIKSVGWAETLLDAIIQEGLADHFAIEVMGSKPAPWNIAVKGKKLQEILKKAEKEFNSKNYNYI